MAFNYDYQNASKSNIVGPTGIDVEDHFLYLRKSEFNRSRKSRRAPGVRERKRVGIIISDVAEFLSLAPSLPPSHPVVRMFSSDSFARALTCWKYVPRGKMGSYNTRVEDGINDLLSLLPPGSTVNPAIRQFCDLQAYHTSLRSSMSQAASSSPLDASAVLDLLSSELSSPLSPPQRLKALTALSWTLTNLSSTSLKGALSSLPHRLLLLAAAKELGSSAVSAVEGEEEEDDWGQARMNRHSVAATVSFLVRMAREDGGLGGGRGRGGSGREGAEGELRRVLEALDAGEGRGGGEEAGSVGERMSWRSGGW